MWPGIVAGSCPLFWVCSGIIALWSKYKSLFFFLESLNLVSAVERAFQAILAFSGDESLQVENAKRIK